jgi:hypothetical protein
MRTNLEKWNYYKKLLEQRASAFLDSISPVTPSEFYMVNFKGGVNKCLVISRYYSFEPHLFCISKPSKRDVETIENLYKSDIGFKAERAYFEYSYVWSIDTDGKEYTAKTAIPIMAVLEKKEAFLSREDAEVAAIEIKAAYDENILFKETHKKDANYDYKANGYKFLGWQNGWKHVYFDEDGNQTTGDASKGEKPKRSFGYTKEEYVECIEQKHRRIEVQHNQRGSENTVSCPICKIYWKYDCSD